MQDASGNIQSTPDTIPVCLKPVYPGLSFTDTTGYFHMPVYLPANEFPWSYTSSASVFHTARRELLEKSLKDGLPVPPDEYRSDWIVPVMLVSFFLLAIVRIFPGSHFRNMMRFVLMRGINEDGSRDASYLFNWQATIFNLSSFISISLFGFLMSRHYGISLPGLGGFQTYLLCFMIVVSGVTSRHIICNITGSISNQQDIFREYLVGIYHMYRLAGLILAFLSVFVLYVVVIPAEVWFKVAFIVVSILYLLRSIRLLLIFIYRRVSILYLILYLCALEILPVVIIVKYVTGLV